MNFDDILKEIVEGVEGAFSATLMGFDGITVANYIRSKSAIDIETLSIEYTKIISEVARTAGAIKAGHVREIAITTDNYYVIFEVLPENYFVALLLDSSSSIGKGRYLLKKTAPDFASQLQ